MNQISRFAIISTGLGALLLIVGAFIHLFAGYPAIVNAIDHGAITKAPGISPNEILAVWSAGAVLMLLAALAPLLVIDQRAVFRRITIAVGIALLLCAGVVMWFTGAHPAVMIFGSAGLLITFGGLRG